MSEQEIIRLQKWRLGVLRHAEEITHNVAKTCRYYGICRTAFYEWRMRYEKEGEEGLRDKSRRPLHSPHATTTEVLAKIIYLRELSFWPMENTSLFTEISQYYDNQIRCVENTQKTTNELASFKSKVQETCTTMEAV